MTEKEKARLKAQADEIRSLDKEKAELKDWLAKSRRVSQIAMRDARMAHGFAEALGHGAACASAFLRIGHGISAQLVLDAVRSATVEDLRNKVAAEMAAIEREADTSRTPQEPK